MRALRKPALVQWWLCGWREHRAGNKCFCPEQLRIGVKTPQLHENSIRNCDRATVSVLDFSVPDSSDGPGHSLRGVTKSPISVEREVSELMGRLSVWGRQGKEVPALRKWFLGQSPLG